MTAGRFIWLSGPVLPNLVFQHSVSVFPTFRTKYSNGTSQDAVNPVFESQISDFKFGISDCKIQAQAEHEPKSTATNDL